MEGKNKESGKEQPRFVSIEKPRRKKRTSSGEKKRLSEAENKLVVGIPPVAGLGVVAVELQLIVVRIQVEHIRIAIAVDNIRGAIFFTARVIRQKRGTVGCILFGSKTPPTQRTKQISFLRQNTDHSARSRNRLRSRSAFAGKVSESLDRPMQPD